MLTHVVFWIAILASPMPQTESIAETTEQAAKSRTPKPSPDWRKRFFEDSEPLKNVPKIVKFKRTGNDFTLTIANKGKTTLTYYAAGDHIQLFQETKQGEEWVTARWDWCGTGKKGHTLEPGKQATLTGRFWDKGKTERMLAAFAEKGTKQSGLVVLADESDPAR